MKKKIDNDKKIELIKNYVKNIRHFEFLEKKNGFTKVVFLV
jgi:hypothetical protein